MIDKRTGLGELAIMSSKPDSPYSAKLAVALAEYGFSPAAAEALLEIDGENFVYMRRVKKGDIPQSLMEEMGAGIEPMQFLSLAAIIRIETGRGRPAEEPTVGLLAEEMQVDASRASRIAADLVERGLVARAASQEDGRRSVLVPTAEGRALLDAFLRAKWQRTMRLFRDWPEEDVLAFARLLKRYNDGMRAQYPTAR